jgi:type VI secretion system protein VasD
VTRLLTRRRALAVPSAFALPSALAACGDSPEPPPPPPTLELSIAAGKNQNPDLAGTAAPVALHLYQLNSDLKFRDADVFALVERGAQTLGADCPASDKLVVLPGETRTLQADIRPNVRFFGVVALFRDIDRAKWRAVQPVAEHGPTRLALHTDGLTVTMAPAP